MQRDQAVIRRLKRFGRGTHWGWLVTTLALGVALILSAGTNLRGARTSAAQLDVGQAQVLKEAVQSLSRPGHRAGVATLDSLLRVRVESGLRFVALIDARDSVLVTVGQPHSDSIVVDRARGPQIESLGDRVRGTFPAPRLGPRPGDTSHRAHPNSSGRPDGPHRGPWPWSGGPPSIVLEFEPIASQEILSRATRVFAVSTVVGLTLMLAGVLLWRAQRTMQDNERRSAEDRRLAMLGRMSAVLAHEIRNPLASLKGHAQLLEERLEAGSADQRKAARVVEEARRLETITNDLLDLSRSGSIDIRPVNPTDLVRASVDDLGGQVVSIDATGAPPAWMLDERRFRLSVLGNLLRNAVEVSPPDRPAEVRVWTQHDHLIFAVRDFGPGIPRGSEDRIFDPFFTTRVSGTGLGLSLARRIVDLHGGTIRAENVAQGGARFVVEIPATGGT
ncbi:MAG: sensor histidine kinase [Gemmatimonadales bacterium]